MREPHHYELIGIGVGAFNLSLAALLEENCYADSMFFERQPRVNWHEGMLFETSKLQVPYLKDLVTPVDPTSRFTFLNYLHTRKILHQFINRKTGGVSRAQFQHYFRWVAERLTNLSFDSFVESVRYDGGEFRVLVSGEEYRCRHLAVGTGISPDIPAWASDHLGARVFHVRDYKRHRDSLTGKRIAVIGGGQSGAEVVLDIMENVDHKSLGWYGRRLGFEQLVDDCFINELYSPSFTEVFRSAPAAGRRAVIDRFASSSNGVSADLLNSIYQLAFERRFFSDAVHNYDFRSGQEVTGMSVHRGTCRLSIDSVLRDVSWERDADVVILATGFRPSGWDILAGVLGEDRSTRTVSDSFEVPWEHGDRNRIFIQNSGFNSIGLAEPNLSVAAWRAAMIANAVIGKEVYARDADTPLVHYA